MGRTSRWFKSLIGSKPTSDSAPAKEKKKKWGFARSANAAAAADSTTSYVEDAADANRHAIAVAAATAVVAEAALAAAHAAAEVVRLTSGGGGSRPGTAGHGGHRRREWAAVKIQSAFRAYLARRALRALKGLVRLQALVRGHIVRRQSADMLRRMQALARIQARVCANRAHVSESSQSTGKSSQTRNPGLATPKRHDQKLHAYSLKSDRSPNQKNGPTKIKNKGSVDLETALKGSNWLNRWMEECSWNNQGASLTAVRPDDERSDKILEVDTCYPHLNLNRTEKLRTSSHHATSYGYGDHGVTLSESLSRHSAKSRKQNPSISSGEALSLSSVKYPTQIDETGVWTSEYSPQVYSTSSRPGSSSGRKGPLTPARSECSRSFFNGYPGYPNYMANTESYRAKVRSQSAPRQRSPFERIGSTTRFYQGYCDSDAISECGSALYGNFGNKAYPGSGRSDRARVSSSRQL